MSVLIVTDYACPFCYVAYRMYRKIEEETGCQFKPVYREIHPDMPASGAAASCLFTEKKRSLINEQLRSWGAPYGIVPQIGSRLSNSRKAIVLRAAVSLYYPSSLQTFDEKMYAAYQQEYLDIGDEEVLHTILQDLRIDQQIQELLSDPDAEKKYRQDDRMAALWSVRKTPSFVIGHTCYQGLMKEDRLKSLLSEEVGKNR